MTNWEDDKYGMCEDIAHWCEHHIPMQFTWLTDKNGKEIYESDVVKWNLPSYMTIYDKSYCIAEVKWNEEGYWLPFNEIVDYDGVKWRDQCADIEIIWNIYENPELLTK